MAASRPEVKDLLPRETLCIASAEPGTTAHRGDPNFLELVGANFATHESNAAEKLVQLKVKLTADVRPDDFWSILLEGMADILDAQYTFVVKRILEDDQSATVEMPPLGDDGSYLMAVALHWSDGANNRGLAYDYKYEAVAGPCSHMRHDKVFVIPAGLDGFITKMAVQLEIPVDAYLGVPLFAEGKCFGHLAAMWSLEGMARRKLTWGFVEMTLHALEDLVIKRLIVGQAFSAARSVPTAPAVTPASAITVAQSLKPYARSLSHELRTPMQGVVGMLDIMHASVLEALEAPPTLESEMVLRQLRENIEVVQDSSRRAVEAAEHVVQAYDFSLESSQSPMASRSSGSWDSGALPETPLSANSIPALKRKRSGSDAMVEGPISKTRVLTASQDQIVAHEHKIKTHEADSDDAMTMSSAPPMRLRILLINVIIDALHTGGRPEHVMTEPSADGYSATIHVRSQSSEGLPISKTIRWAIGPHLPDDIPGTYSHDLSRAVLALVLNALRFTSTGHVITITARSSSSAGALISVADTGVGIPTTFLPRLFKPFAREDDTIRRRSEGLGLGLWVAQKTARGFGGDVRCVRTETEGAAQGSEFEVIFPLEERDRQLRQQTSISGRARSPAKQGLVISREASLRSANSEPLTVLPSPEIQAPSNSPPLSLPSIKPAPFISGRDARNSVASTMRRPPSNSSRSIVSYNRYLATTYPLHFLVAEDNRINRKLLVAMLGKMGYKNVHEAHDGAEAVRLMAQTFASVDGDQSRQGAVGDHRQESESESPDRGREKGRGKRWQSDEEPAEDRGRDDDQEHRVRPAQGRHNDASGSYASTPLRIDVILMDLWMPDVDGYQATEQIFALERKWRASASHSHHPDHPGVRILAVTADVTEQAIERGRAAGMCGFIYKPFTLADLERVIVEHCVERKIDEDQA